MTDRNDLKVVIKTADGMYLTGTSASSLGFSSDLYGAIVFDYEEDRVADKIALLRNVHGLELQAIPLRDEEVFEKCDRCAQWSNPLTVIFNGRQFLCIECSKHAAEP
jgi:hypothetical protein